jgi:hypothetical protein
MRLSTDHDVLLDHAKRSFANAMPPALRRVIAIAPRRTGHFATTYDVRIGETGGAIRGGNPQARIGSTHKGARAIELGADVGPRRGPHMEAAGRMAEEADDIYFDAMDDSLWRTR